MSQERKKYLIGTFICIAIMFLLIPVTILLTKNKEVSEFTQQDNYIFIGFIAAEVINGVIAFILAAKAGKALPKDQAFAMQKQESDMDKVTKRQGWLLLGSAWVLGLASMIAGIVFVPRLPQTLLPHMHRIKWICCILPVILALGNVLTRKCRDKMLQKMNARQKNEYLLAQREKAEEITKKKLAFLGHWQRLTLLYTIVLGFIAFGVGFLGSMSKNPGSEYFLCFYSGFLYLAALSRIRFPVPQKIFLDDDARIKPEEYPVLYAHARKAADTIGCSGEIIIFLGSGCNAGISRCSGFYAVQLGVTLLSVMSQEELYNILLHEFSHVAQKNKNDEKARTHASWLAQEGNPHFASSITTLLFTGFNAIYTLQYALYLYASSILQENDADQAMAVHGTPEVAASALMKLKYNELFEWELPTYDAPCPMEPETLDKDVFTKRVRAFKEAMASRSADWNRLLEAEILSRTASHPTTKMRLDALGVTQYCTLPANHEGAYLAECQKAVAYLDSLFYEQWSKTYEADRQAEYLEPKKLVDAWEEAGRPIVAEEYGDLIDNLQLLGKYRTAAELCQRVIAELPPAACCYAHFMRGCFLLHCYDDRGLEHIYTAIEGNSNYIDEGLNLIGMYCCRTGNQEELSCYREKAVELAQKALDVYSQLEFLKKGDQLSEEKLPEGMLEDILQYIRSVDSGAIQSVYLVRKTITQDCFTSAFIVRFRDGAEDKEKDEIMHKIFCHLDTCSDWQFSLFTYDNVKSVKPETIENSLVYAPTGQTDR